MSVDRITTIASALESSEFAPLTAILIPPSIEVNRPCLRQWHVNLYFSSYQCAVIEEARRSSSAYPWGVNGFFASLYGLSHWSDVCYTPIEAEAPLKIPDRASLLFRQKSLLRLMR